MKKVLVFGTFDGLHDGHRDFLGQAKKLGGMLVVTVASDEAVKQLKGHAPRFSAEERINKLKKESLGDICTAGDTRLGNWTSIREYAPDIVALGYDQRDLYDALTYDRGLFPSLKIVRLKPHKDKNLHSSIIQKTA